MIYTSEIQLNSLGSLGICVAVMTTSISNNHQQPDGLLGNLSLYVKEKASV